MTTTIVIENYRGYNITFDTSAEKFECVCTENDSKESSSFAAVKKFIDEFKKANQDFKPFWVERIPGTFGYEPKKLKVIGIRKDKRFIVETEDNKQEQLSDYNLKDYMIIKPENKEVLNKLDMLAKKEAEQKLENAAVRKELTSKLVVVNLQEYKASLE